MKSLKIVREPDDLGEPYEDCCICGKPTRYWHDKKDVPLCPECARETNARDLPSKLEWAHNYE